MRHLWGICFIVVLLGIQLMPVQAQGTIATVIDSRAELSTLSAFLDAAPDVREQLEQSGSYTLFAPNNTAFDNLESALNTPIGDLLSSVELVTAILEYHILDTSLTSDQLVARNGQVIQTQLQNAFIGIRTDDNGELSVNNVVEVVEADISAGNGQIHIINDVLLNRVIDNLVAELNLSDFIVPNVSPTPVASPSPTPTATASAVTTTGRVRFINAIVDSPRLSISFEDNDIIDQINFSDATDFIDLAQGVYTATFRDPNGVLEGLVEFTLLSRDFTTIVLVGSLTDDTFEAVTFEEDFAPLDDVSARVTVLHAIYETPAADIFLGDETIADGLEFATLETTIIDAGTYRLQLEEDNSQEGIITLDDVELVADSSYLVIATGTGEMPDILIYETSAETLEQLQSGASDTATINVTPTPADIREGSIVDTLEEDDDFTILLAAIQVADEAIINRLDDADSTAVTLLAPTDAAFENLLSTTGFSQERLLSETDILTDILLYHMIDGITLEEDFRVASNSSIVTLLTPDQAFFVAADTDGTLFLNGRIQFEQTDIRVSNGVLHIIDDVLLPQSALDALGL